MVTSGNGSTSQEDRSSHLFLSRLQVHDCNDVVFLGGVNLIRYPRHLEGGKSNVWSHESTFR